MLHRPDIDPADLTPEERCSEVASIVDSVGDSLERANAALLAAQLPPGKDRTFALMNWPDYDSGALEPIRKDAKNTEQMPLILASDRDAGAIQRAKENAERAGVADYIQFSCRSLSAIEPPAESGVIVTNPPYGV
jgi:putative N6-adenine-specific DNA methylase